MNKDMFIVLANILQKLESKNLILVKTFGENDFLNNLMYETIEVVLDQFGFPKDNSLILYKQYGIDSHNMKKFFTRDYLHDLFQSFLNGELSIEETFEELLREKETLLTKKELI